MMRITESVTSRMSRLRNFDLAVKRPLIAVEPLNGQTLMAASIKFLPGATIRWHGRRYVIVDYAGLSAIVGREFGQRKLERIPIAEAQPDQTSHSHGIRILDLVSVPENSWQTAVEKFKALRPLLEMDEAKRTRAAVTKTAHAIGKHPATIYRWIHQYKSSERLSVLLRKERSDRGKSRLTNKVDHIIDTAIKKFYLTAESPDMTAVVEEVDLQCFKHKIKKKPHPNTVRARISMLSDRLILEKRKGRKTAAEKYEPIKGHFPGAN
jgi:putative transposase